MYKMRYNAHIQKQEIKKGALCAMKIVVCSLNEGIRQNFAFLGAGCLCDQKEKAFCAIEKQTPDVLILSNELLCSDGLSVLKKLQTEKLCDFPSVLFYTQRENGVLLEKIKAMPVDALLFHAPTMEEVRRIYEQDFLFHVPKLKTHTEYLRYKAIELFLQQIHMKRNLKGYRYLVMAVELYLASPNYFKEDLDHRMYAYVREKNNTSKSAVEKNIRSAIERTFLYGDIRALEKLFGYTVSEDKGKLTNYQMISQIAEHVRIVLNRRPCER